ncbi:MAG: trypsin-like peptidase domain-containing protein [Bacilli bacterium]|nr:trypsin-like peptidase domain-containing protein [Bacilli bacterium]
MKKKLLIIVPIVLALVIILIIISVPKNYKTDFNLDIDLSTSTNEITNKLVSNTSNDYKIDTTKKYILSNKDKKEIEKLIKKYLDALTKTDLSSIKYSGDINKYLVRFPSMSIDEYDDFYNSPKYKEYSNGSITLDAIHMLFYSREFKFKELKEIAYDYVTKEEIITKSYLDDVTLTYGNKKYTLDAIVELSIRYEEESKQFKIFNINIEWVRDLETYLKIIDKTERSINNKSTNKLNNAVSYIPTGYGDFNYNKLKALNGNITNKVYLDNKDSIVVINSVNELGLPTGNSTGFFIKSGILVTTYDSLYSMIENGSRRIYADINGKAVLIDGVVSIYPDLNIAILKLKEEIGNPVKIGDSSKIEKNDPVIIISSSIGLTSTIKTGIYLNTIKDDINVLRTSLPLTNGDTGSPIFNTEGLVIGINNDVKPSIDSYYSGINNSIDISVLKDVIEKINNTEFNTIKTTELSSLKIDNIKVVNKVKEKVWEKYLDLPVITNYIPIDLYSAYTKDNYLIVRYKSTDNMFDNDMIINIYTKNLIKENYKEVATNVFKKGNVTITIKNNLGFIIVIVEGVN